MPNILEAATNMIQSLLDEEPKQPLHIGEAMNCWLYLTSLGEATVLLKTALILRWIRI